MTVLLQKSFGFFLKRDTKQDECIYTVILCLFANCYFQNKQPHNKLDNKNCSIFPGILFYLQFNAF